MAEENGAGLGSPVRSEKLSPVSGVQKAKDLDDAIDKMMACLEYQGKGHSCGIHTTDVEDVNKLAAVAPVTKCVVNQPQCLTNSGGWDCGFPVSSDSGVVVLGAATAYPTTLPGKICSTSLTFPDRSLTGSQKKLKTSSMQM